MAKEPHPIIKKAEELYDKAHALKATGDGIRANTAYIESAGQCFCIIEAEKGQYDQVTQAQAYYHRGRAYYELGDLKDAGNDFSMAIEKDPSLPVAYNGRGVVLEKQGSAAAAEADYRKAIALDASYPAPYSNLGILLKKQGKFAEAMEYFAGAIELQPEAKMPYNGRGFCHQKLGNRAAAIADFSEALRIDPAYAVARGNRAAAYLNDGNPDAAIWDADVLIASGKPRETGYMVHGKALMMKGHEHYAQACGDFEHVCDSKGATHMQKAEAQKMITELRRFAQTQGMKEWSASIAAKVVPVWGGRRG